VATYVATKHAVVGLTESVRLELRGTGIELSAVCPAPVATELFSGIDASGVLKPIQPQEVADAIVAVLQRPAPVAVVPPAVGKLIKTFSLLPPRVNERVAKLLKTDNAMLKGLNPEQRAAYELRAARSEPGLEAGDEQQQLTA
jgi:short-subunit dehydrogenase